MDTNSFLVLIKTEDFYIEIAKMLEQDFILQITNEKKLKSNWITEKWIRLENNDRVCCTETKNI